MTEAKKRLYTVTVELEYAVLAEDERDAMDYAHDALRDVSIRDYAHASLTVQQSLGNVKKPLIRRPDDYDEDSLVYGADEDITLKEAIEAEVAAMTEQLEKEEFDEKQGKLF